MTWQADGGEQQAAAEENLPPFCFFIFHPDYLLIGAVHIQGGLPSFTLLIPVSHLNSQSHNCIREFKFPKSSHLQKVPFMTA